MRRPLDSGYELDDDPARIDLAAVHAFLRDESYWAAGRPLTTVVQQHAWALRVIGLYAVGGEQVGYARIAATTGGGASLGDVYVLAAHRGRRLGLALVEEAVARGPQAALAWSLRTADAHALYERFGFARSDDRLMERPAAPGDYHSPAVAKPLNFQQMIATLQQYWADRGCVVMQPYHTEVGAGTFNPATALRCLGPRPWRAAYVEPSIRPSDGRYGENPFRFQHYFQYQVILKPAPDDVVDLYFGSLEAIGIDLAKHDIRLVEDDWEGPTLGAWGLGWEVWIDGMEATQFTYFQQFGGLDLDLVPAELTYGLERLAMFLQGKRTAFEIEWAPGVTWGDVYKENERQWSAYNFEEAPVEKLMRRFAEHEEECAHLVSRRLPLPAYDQVLKASHSFNLLDARGAISVTERAAYIGRVRNLARDVCKLYVAMERESLGLEPLDA